MWRITKRRVAHPAQTDQRTVELQVREAVWPSAQASCTIVLNTARSANTSLRPAELPYAHAYAWPLPESIGHSNILVVAQHTPVVSAAGRRSEDKSLCRARLPPSVCMNPPSSP